MQSLRCGADEDAWMACVLAIGGRDTCACSEAMLVVGLDFAFSFPEWFIREWR